MEDLSNNPVPLSPSWAPEPLPGPSHQSSHVPPPPPTLAQESPYHFDGWEAINEQEFYDEQGFLCLSRNLTSEKLKHRKEDDVVIFDYSLSRADGNPPLEGSGPSSRGTGEADDRFFQVSKDRLTESEQFSQVISPTKESRSIRARLGIIDFPQCYDTSDHNLINSMAKGLHLPNPATFGEAHSKRVLTLPGRGSFRTGFTLRVPPKNPSQLAKPDSSEDRITLFVSFPYFGKSSSSIPLGPESESVEILDFKSLGVDVPDRSDVESPEDKDTGRILVHQARYMIFDNYTMATFRSKEDSAKNQVPLDSHQERIGAFRAMIHMISNRMDGESWILEKLQAYLCKLEGDIDQGISYSNPDKDIVPIETIYLPLQKLSVWQVKEEGVVREKCWRLKDLIASLNRLSASFLAAISVAERQIAVLQDLHDLFLTSCRTKFKGYEKGYELGENPLYKNIAPIPILSENSEQILPNTLDAIDEIVRQRECFIKKVKELVENMDTRRKILSAYLDCWKAASAMQEVIRGSLIEGTAKMTHYEIVQQGRGVVGFTLITLAFLPLNFATSYFGMQTIKEFGGSTPRMSAREFWKITAPASIGILLLIVITVMWTRTWAIQFRHFLRGFLHWAIENGGLFLEKKLGSALRKKRSDPELAWVDSGNSQERGVGTLPVPRLEEGTER